MHKHRLKLVLGSSQDLRLLVEEHDVGEVLHHPLQQLLSPD